MLSVKGIYENGKIKLLEDIPLTKRANVIVTILEQEEQEKEDVDPKLFDDLIGVVSLREDGSSNHDQYLASEGRS